jgi:hypothetical protein
MNEIKKILKQVNFKWLPKHINHIVEHIVFDKRNVSFLAINALFRIQDYTIEKSSEPFKNSYIISGFVPLQPNDKLRIRPEILNVVFRVDERDNIIVLTAYSENDEN